MESRALMVARHSMEKAHAKLRVATWTYHIAIVSVATAVISFFGAITLNAIALIGEGTAWAWGGFGVIIFGIVGGGLFIYIDDEDISITESRVAFEEAQRMYVDQLDREVSQ